MEKADITKIKPIISDVPQAVKGSTTRRIIPMRTVGRDSDGFIYILEGSCHYTFDDGMELDVKKNDILYLADNAKYRMDVNCDRYEYYVVNFTFAHNNIRKSAVYTPRATNATEQHFSRLLTQRDPSSPLSIAEKMTNFYRLMSTIIECDQRQYIGGETRAKIERAADSIHCRASDPSLSVARLAAEASLSEVYFRRLFVRRYGVPPAHYIIQARIDLARQLMRVDGLRLEEIAEQSGFSSLPYFCKVFRTITGSTPAVYRKRSSAN